MLVFAAGFLADRLWRGPRAESLGQGPISGASRRSTPRTVSSAPRRSDPSREIVVARDPEPAREPRAPEARREGGARLAILIDDLGNDARALGRVTAIAPPLSGAVLPGLAHSAETAEALARARKEVLLHLPLEPVNSLENPGPGLVRASMSEREVDEVIARDLGQVPHAVGVNNHMGSRGTADSRLMDEVMAAIGPRGLYFLDSRTTEWTRAGEAARRYGVPFLSRNVFLDDVSSEEAISRQLQRAIDTARTVGFAVAIGHPHATTLSVLERRMPELAGDGITPVFVSELLR